MLIEPLTSIRLASPSHLRSAARNSARVVPPPRTRRRIRRAGSPTSFDSRTSRNISRHSRCLAAPGRSPRRSRRPSPRAAAISRPTARFASSDSTPADRTTGVSQRPRSLSDATRKSTLLHVDEIGERTPTPRILKTARSIAATSSRSSSVRGTNRHGIRRSARVAISRHRARARAPLPTSPAPRPSVRTPAPTVAAPPARQGRSANRASRSRARAGRGSTIRPGR